MWLESVSPVHELYLRSAAIARGTRVVVTLRRYKNKDGHWPESLDEVKSLAPAEVFVDPINGFSFVYKRTDHEFTIYSKGKNGIDDGGERDKWGKPKAGADDWLIWPPRSRKSEKEDADAEQQ
jgi:hypothetical protein